MRRLGLALAVFVLAAGAARAQDGVRPHVEAAAARFALPADLIEAVIAVESGGRTGAVSPAGAMGLMQLMPGTWTDLRSRLGLGADPFDPADNIVAGAAYLRELLDRYGAPGFLAAYNAGPARYEASLAGRPLPLETRLYVARLSGMQGAASPVRPDWRAAGLFPPAWSQGLGAAGVTALGGPASSGGERVFTVRREAGQ
ncbi:lytic transglycosylase domain-containing protein [Caulobacter sp. RHG1]|uniref:lytic transglycosylase domain-containing protein n=1 Tax=Caulobacter sp. (strain RHG1) TaxID=2545762 RepID=UPI001552C2B7|nr:lytic transglycosylase domain-containing protein [Caulobacter sp. RHG1]NQE65023.1 Membrane-bound lytic murein transglycosylase C [Caulobacter sp. RHG1]